MAIGSRMVVLYRLRLSAAPVIRMETHSEKAISTGMHTRIKCRDAHQDKMQGILYSQPECLAVKDLYEILHAHKLPAHCLEKGTDHHIYKGYEHKYGCPPKTWSQEQPGPHMPQTDAGPVP